MRSNIGWLDNTPTFNAYNDLISRVQQKPVIAEKWRLNGVGRDGRAAVMVR